LIGGGAISVMIWTHVAWLQPSLAVHVRVMTSSAVGHGPPDRTSDQVMVGVGPLSVAVAVPVVPGRWACRRGR
jgi:hypothetical protein